MATVDFQSFKYQNRIPRSTQAKRLAWGIVWSLLIRPTPRFCLHAWRGSLYRLFGAKIGHGSKIDPSCKVWAPWNLEIGQFTALAAGVDCYNVDKVILGSKVAISQRAFLCTASHRTDTLQRELIHRPITIGDHAWVCAEAFIGPGVELGKGAVAAARAVVVKPIPPWSIWGGNPARMIRKREVQMDYLQDT